MVAKSRGRKLRIELLERRTLLSVTVSVVSGTLIVTGDSNANVVAIDQVDTSGGTGVQPGTFLITPGAKTSLNGGTPGAAVTLSGATAGIRVSLGAGTDSLDMQGVAGQPLSPFAISITPGTGHNTIRIADFSVSTVSITCKGFIPNETVDSVEIDDTTIDGGGGTGPALVLQAQQGYASAVLAGDDIGPSSPSGTPASMSLPIHRSMNFALAIRDTTFNGDVTATMDKSGGAVQLENSTIAGALSVTSLGPANVTLDQSQADSGFIKIGSLPSNQSTVDVSGSLVTHKLDIETTGGSDISTDNSTAGEIYLKLDGILADLTGASGVTVGTGLTLSSHGTLHKGEINGVQADSFFLKMGALPSDQSSFDVTDAQVTHKLDIETTGGTNGSVTNSFAGSFSGGLDNAGEIYLKLDGMQADLTAANGVTVGGLTVSSDKSHDAWIELNGVQGDDVTISKATPKLYPGSSWSWGVSNSSIAHKLDIEGTGATDGSVQNSSAGELYLKLDGIKADLTATNGVVVGGGLTASSDSKHNDEIMVNAVQADDVSLLMGSSTSGQSSFDVSGSQVAHKLDIETTGTTDGSVENSGGGEIYLKLDGIREDLASDSGTTDVSVGGVLTVSTHGTVHNAEVYNVNADSLSLNMGSSATDKSSPKLLECHVAHKLDIESAAGRMSCTAQGNTAGDFFLKFGALQEELTAPTGGVASQDTLAVNVAPGVLSMTADGVQAGGMTLNLTSPSAQTPSNVQLSDINLSGQLNVTSLGPSNFYLGPAKTGSSQTGGGPSFGLLATDMFFTASTLPGPQPGPSKVVLQDVLVTGQLQVAGGGNDTIIVAGSTIDGTARFDGGSGSRNKLNIAGNQFAVAPVTVHFATTTQ
jgi:hypothetical protein